MKIQNLYFLTSSLYIGTLFPCSMRIWFDGCWAMLLTNGEDTDRAADSAFCYVQNSPSFKEVKKGINIKNPSGLLFLDKNIILFFTSCCFFFLFQNPIKSVMHCFSSSSLLLGVCFCLLGRMIVFK